MRIKIFTDVCRKGSIVAHSFNIDENFLLGAWSLFCEVLPYIVRLGAGVAAFLADVDSHFILQLYYFSLIS